MKKPALSPEAALLPLLFLLLLMDPQTAAAGAKRGLLLWFDVLLPALFPFILVTRLLTATNLVAVFSRVLYPFLGPLLGVSPNGSFCVLTGFLCGYPMGAKTICDLREGGGLSRQEAAFLLTFCNNASPGFVTGFLAVSCLGGPSLGLPLLLILYGVPLLYAGVGSRLGHRKPGGHEAALRHRRASGHGESPSQSLQACGVPQALQLSRMDLGDAVYNSLGTSALIGGYVMAFSLLAAFPQSLPFLPPAVKALLCASLEITSGAPALCQAFRQETAFVLLCAFASFGGLSAAAQTSTFIKKSGLSIRSYFLHKLFQALLSAAAALAAARLLF